ncbi:MAG TPA: xanthine dehydrogenase family protein subunit M [Ramlibacter sp.]|nr:xanthine dehydrogenase family protein subunit M [Ramlibacter sp.]
MYAFTFERPTTLADANKLAQKSNVKLLAGGQSLVAALKLRLANPDQLVDLGAIAELARIAKEGSGLKIGAMARHADVASSTDVKSVIPALADVAGQIGDRQVRAMGTLGGSIANNDPAADYPAAVLALDATVHTTLRQIAASDFFNGLFTTALGDGELITHVTFPAPKRAAYMKFKQPASRFALIGVFVADTANGVRVAVTGGGNGVYRHAGLEQALAKAFTPQSAASVKIDAGELAADIHASAAYRANLVSVMAQRAVAKALE